MRMTVVIDDDAYHMLNEMAGGERKKGELLGQLIREESERRNVVTRAELDAVRSELRALAQRVDNLEQGKER